MIAGPWQSLDLLDERDVVALEQDAACARGSAAQSKGMRRVRRAPRSRRGFASLINTSAASSMTRFMNSSKPCNKTRGASANVRASRVAAVTHDDPALYPHVNVVIKPD